MNTPEQTAWDLKLEQTLNAQPKHWPGTKRVQVAHLLMRKHHGRRPAGPPWYLKLGLKLIVKKLVKEDFKMQLTPILSAVGFAIAAALAAAQTAGADGVISGLQEWLGIAGAGFSAGWAALKNPKKAISLKG